jgi:hypothetical protein
MTNHANRARRRCRFGQRAFDGVVSVQARPFQIRVGAALLDDKAGVPTRRVARACSAPETAS